MALTIKTLLAAELSTSGSPSVYAPGSGKAALIKTFSFVNKTATARTVSVKLKNGNPVTEWLVFPSSMEVPAHSQVILDREITLQHVDDDGYKLELFASAIDAIDCIISGVERDN